MFKSYSIFGGRLPRTIALVAQLGVAGCMADATAATPVPQGPQTVAPAQPATPEPTALPPPMPGPAPVTVAGDTGQWSFTSQYGWIWMPYAQQYTSVASDSSIAYQYVYYPTTGWRWLYAPWVLGWGPSPWWGRIGPARFAWYSRPWFRVGLIHRTSPAYFGHAGVGHVAVVGGGHGWHRGGHHR